MNLPIKVETALAAYLEAEMPSNLTIRPSRQGGPPIEGPLLLITAHSPQVHPDLPPTAGTYALDVDFDLSAPDAASLANPQGHLAAALVDLTGLQASVNTDPNDLTIHDLEITDSSTTPLDDQRRLLTTNTRLTLANAAT